MSQKRNMPSRQKIADYWSASKEGQDHILRIRDTYHVDVSDLLCIENDIPHCWACNVTSVSASSSYNDSYLGLDRCHIIPKALGGPDAVENLVLMCTRCHNDSPDTIDESIFWKWFTQREDGRAHQPSAIQFNALSECDQAILLKCYESDPKAFQALHMSCYDWALDETQAITPLARLSCSTKHILSNMALTKMVESLKEQAVKVPSNSFLLEAY